MNTRIVSRFSTPAWRVAGYSLVVAVGLLGARPALGQDAVPCKSADGITCDGTMEPVAGVDLVDPPEVIKVPLVEQGEPAEFYGSVNGDVLRVPDLGGKGDIDPELAMCIGREPEPQYSIEKKMRCATEEPQYSAPIDGSWNKVLYGSPVRVTPGNDMYVQCARFCQIGTNDRLYPSDPVYEGNQVYDLGKNDCEGVMFASQFNGNTPGGFKSAFRRNLAGREYCATMDTAFHKVRWDDVVARCPCAGGEPKHYGNRPDDVARARPVSNFTRNRLRVMRDDFRRWMVCQGNVNEAPSPCNMNYCDQIVGPKINALHRDTYWRKSNPNAPGDLLYPTKQQLANASQNPDDYDQLSHFSGMDVLVMSGSACAHGDIARCDDIGMSQEFNVAKADMNYGAFYRAPYLMPSNAVPDPSSHYGTISSFSRDAASGVLLYLLKLGETNLLDAQRRGLAWYKFIERNPRHNPLFPNLCPEVANKDVNTDWAGCNVDPGFLPLMSAVAKKLGFFNDLSFAQRTSLTASEVLDYSILYTSIQTAPIDNFQYNLLYLNILIKKMSGKPWTSALDMLMHRSGDNRPDMGFTRLGYLSEYHAQELLKLCPIDIGQPPYGVESFDTGNQGNGDDPTKVSSQAAQGGPRHSFTTYKNLLPVPSPLYCEMLLENI